MTRFWPKWNQWLLRSFGWVIYCLIPFKNSIHFSYLGLTILLTINSNLGSFNAIPIHAYKLTVPFSLVLCPICSITSWASQSTLYSQPQLKENSKIPSLGITKTSNLSSCMMATKISRLNRKFWHIQDLTSLMVDNTNNLRIPDFIFQILFNYF